MSTKALEIDDRFAQVMQALEAAPKRVLPFLREPMRQSLRLLQGLVNTYPPATEANRPGRVDQDGRPLGYYERGRGWWDPVAARATLGDNLGVRFGAQSGKQAARRYKLAIKSVAAGYKLRKGGESEQLGKSWAIAIDESPAGIIGQLGTNTSYADYVSGDRQALFHEQRNWVDTERALTEADPKIVELFSAATDRYLASLTGA